MVTSNWAFQENRELCVNFYIKNWELYVNFRSITEILRNGQDNADFQYSVKGVNIVVSRFSVPPVIGKVEKEPKLRTDGKNLYQYFSRAKNELRRSSSRRGYAVNDDCVKHPRSFLCILP